MLVYDKPLVHPRISKEEREYIEKVISQDEVSFLNALLRYAFVSEFSNSENWRFLSPCGWLSSDQALSGPLLSLTCAIILACIRFSSRCQLSSTESMDLTSNR